MNNPIFTAAISQLQALFSNLEAEMARQDQLQSQIATVKASLANLEGLEKEARGRLATAEADVQTALRKYSEAQQTAQQILTNARTEAQSIRERALAQAEEDAARITEAALDEARQSVRRKRETRTGG